jgi:hypothetical protein
MITIARSIFVVRTGRGGAAGPQPARRRPAGPTSPVLRRVGAVGVALALACGPGAAATVLRGGEPGGGGGIGAAERPRAATFSQGGVTTVRFHVGLLEDLGLRIEDLAGRSLEAAEVRLTAFPPSGFVFRAPDGDFERFDRGELTHLGGLQLVRESGERARLAGFVVRAGREERTLEVFDPEREEVLLVADHAHFVLGAGRLRLFNLDLRATPALAARLAWPALAGQPLGSLEVETAIPHSGLDLHTSGPPAPEQTCGPETWPGDPRPGGGVYTVDVELSEMASVAQMLRRREDFTQCVPGDPESCLVVISPSARLRNVGTADVPWYSKRSGNFPPYGNDQHPYLVWHLYRAYQGRFEMLAASAVKHAFMSGNTGCRCVQAHILYASNGAPNHPPEPTPQLTELCDDVYATTTNNFSSALGPRSEITAHTGVWNDVGFVFPSTFATTSDRRLAVPESELGWPGAQYYLESWYLVREDVNIYNSMGYRFLDPKFDGTIWRLLPEPPVVDPGFQNGPAIDAWVPPNNPPPGAATTRIDTGQGHLTLAVRSYDLGGGLYQYEYALVNHDEDRRIASFSVPFGGDVVDLPAFRDLDRQPASDWLPQQQAGRLTWTASDPETQALDWGIMFSFGLRATSPPGIVPVRLGLYEGGGELVVETIGPSGGSGLLLVDDLETGDSGAWDESSP